MTQLPQTGSHVTSINQNQPPVSAIAMPDGMPLEQKAAFAEYAAANLPGKKRIADVLREHHHILGWDAEQKIEYFCGLIASLESCNSVLGNRLAQAEREIAGLRKSAARHLQKTEFGGNPEQLYRWERKLTRRGWGTP